MHERDEVMPAQQELSRMGWPDALVKATVDCWFYFALIRGCGVIPFTDARPTGGGAYALLGVAPDDMIDRSQFPALSRLHPAVLLSRGLEVRVADVVWVVDQDS